MYPPPELADAEAFLMTTKSLPASAALLLLLPPRSLFFGCCSRGEEPFRLLEPPLPPRCGFLEDSESRPLLLSAGAPLLYSRSCQALLLLPSSKLPLPLRRPLPLLLPPRPAARVRMLDPRLDPWQAGCVVLQAGDVCWAGWRGSSAAALPLWLAGERELRNALPAAGLLVLARIVPCCGWCSGCFDDPAWQERRGRIGSM